MQNLKELQDGILVMMKLINIFPFNFKYLNYDCMIIYEGFYHNGYVGFTKNHPFYGLNYNDIDIDVHGGLTFSQFGGEYHPEFNDNNEKLYWIGFDCQHHDDLEKTNGSIYSWKCNKTPEYIANEIFRMVHQLIEKENVKRNSIKNGKNRKITILENNDEEIKEI